MMAPKRGGKRVGGIAGARNTPIEVPYTTWTERGSSVSASSPPSPFLLQGPPSDSVYFVGSEGRNGDDPLKKLPSHWPVSKCILSSSSLSHPSSSTRPHLSWGPSPKTLLFALCCITPRNRGSSNSKMKSRSTSDAVFAASKMTFPLLFNASARFSRCCRASELMRC